jgi:hypothetical protein
MSLLSDQGHVILCKREADCFPDAIRMSGNFFKPLIDWGIEILLTTLETYPSGDVINVNCLASKIKLGSSQTAFYNTFAKLAWIMLCHSLTPLIPLQYRL